MRKLPSQDAQVLCVELAVQLHAVLAVESMVDQLAIRVDFVEDRIGVGTLTGSKGYHFKVPAHSLQKTYRKWSNRNVSLFCGLVKSQVDLHVVS